MQKKMKILQDICDVASAEVRALYPNLQLLFIPHESGQFHEVLETSEYEIARHPAGKTAQAILDKNHHREQSSFIGMAIHHESRWFGLASKDHLLAIFNINMDELANAREARKTIYHLVWHAIDLMDVRQRPEYLSKFRSGPMIPKRSPMNLAHLNLQADIFAAVMSGLHGEENAIRSLAHQRAKDSIAPVHARRAEDYPFVIALDAVEYAYRELTAIEPQSNKFMAYARQLSNEVAATFDDKSIQQWWGFSEPGQEMAWRNFPDDMILGCAVYTCEDPFVRAIGHLVSELSGISPLPLANIGNGYNAYASPQQNQTLHRETADKTFEEAVAMGMQAVSCTPLIEVANQQNEKLTEGIIIGWCANALQAAARAFENALSLGVAPDQAARLEFAGNRDVPEWGKLQKAGEEILDRRRKGFAVTMASVAEICGNHQGLATVVNSVKATIKDPGYMKKLEAANDLAVRGPAMAPAAAPSAPVPKTPAPSTPAFAPAMPAPGLGSGGSNVAARQRAMMERQRQDSKDGGDTDRTK